jgi:predicted actin-binding protein
VDRFKRAGHARRISLTVATCVVTALVLAAAGTAARDAAPSNTAPPTISGTPQAGQTLTAQPGTWTGTQPISYSYQWQRCNPNGAACNDIAGAGSSSYTAAPADVTNTLRVRVTAKNADGSNSTTSVPTAVVRSAVSQISLQSSRKLILFGDKVMLTGAAAGASPGMQVTVRGYHPGRKSIFPVGVTSVQADGSFSIAFHPSQRTIFIARIGTLQSNPMSVNVRPRVRVHRRPDGRLRFDVSAARSLAGHYLVIQRWKASRHVWVAVQRVYLRRSFTGKNFVISSASVRLHLGHVMARALLPLGQTVPGYLSSTSGAFTA